MKRTILIAGLLLVTVNTTFAQINYPVKLAETIMNTYKDSMVVLKYASHLEQDNLIMPGQTAEEAQKNRPAVWNYEMGVVLTGFERLAQISGDSKYYEYTKRILDHFITAEGGIRTYTLDEYNLDNIPTGRQLLHLYQRTKEEKYKKAAALLYKQLAWQPRNKIGGYWHKLQKWADPKTGLSRVFWSRAMGWYMMALVDVLDYLPANYKRRAELIVILNRLSTALIKFQDAKEGVWWQVTDKANATLNYLESSSSAMFVYALSKAVNKNYISKSFSPAILKAYNGIIKNFVVVDKDGTVHYTKAVAGAGLGGTPYRDGTYEYYVNEPKRDDDLKAIGPFIQACIEYNLLVNVK